MIVNEISTARFSFVVKQGEVLAIGVNIHLLSLEPAKHFSEGNTQISANISLIELLLDEVSISGSQSGPGLLILPVVFLRRGNLGRE